MLAMMMSALRSRLTVPVPLSARNVFDLPVAHTERTGSDATGYLRWDESLLALRVEPGQAARLQSGQTVRVAFPKGKANLFDATTGERL